MVFLNFYFTLVTTLTSESIHCVFWGGGKKAAGLKIPHVFNVLASFCLLVELSWCPAAMSCVHSCRGFTLPELLSRLVSKTVERKLLQAESGFYFLPRKTPFEEAAWSIVCIITLKSMLTGYILIDHLTPLFCYNFDHTNILTFNFSLSREPRWLTLKWMRSGRKSGESQACQVVQIVHEWHGFSSILHKYRHTDIPKIFALNLFKSQKPAGCKEII